MRVFEKDGNVLKTNDEITARAILGSGYTEIKQSAEVEETKPKKRKIED